MSIRIVFLLMVFATLKTNGVHAQDFFWSDVNFGSGASNTDVHINAVENGSGTVFLYYEAGGADIDAGLSLDFSWNGNGAGFTAAETFEFDIDLANVGPFQLRWNQFAGPANSVTANAVEGFQTVKNPDGTGILNSQADGFPFNDTGYDLTANAFLVGSFDWDFDFAKGGKGGSTLVVDNSVVISAGVNIGASFNQLTISAVPEPTSAILLAIGITGIFTSRFRKTRQ